MKINSCLLDTPHRFLISTDNQATACIFFGAKTKNARLTRYALEIMNRVYQIINTPGHLMAHVDAVSRYTTAWMKSVEETIQKYNSAGSRKVKQLCRTQLKISKKTILFSICVWKLAFFTLWKSLFSLVLHSFQNFYCFH